MKEDAVMLRMLRIAALAGLCLAALANAGDELKYTGQIVGIESREEMIRLEEIGPWTGPTRGLHTRTIQVTPETHITLIGRSDGTGADGWVGQFVEAPLTAADLHRGDYVTVATALQPGRLVARSIAVIRPAAP